MEEGLQDKRGGRGGGREGLTSEEQIRLSLDPEESLGAPAKF